MPAIRTRGLQTLATALAGAIPELVGRIDVGPQLRGAQVSYPCVQLIPARTLPVWEQEVKHLSVITGAKVKPTASSLVVDVGYWEVTLQLRVSHVHPFSRERLESAIFDLFAEGARFDEDGARLSGFNGPGCITTRIDGANGEVCTFDFDEDTAWQDPPEMAASDRRESVTTIDAVFPILITRTGVTTVQELRLALTEDMTTTVTDDFENEVVAEVNVVEEDGTLSDPVL